VLIVSVKFGVLANGMSTTSLPIKLVHCSCNAPVVAGEALLYTVEEFVAAEVLFRLRLASFLQEGKKLLDKSIVPNI